MSNSITESIPAAASPSLDDTHELKPLRWWSPVRYIFAGIVTLITFVVYYLTTQATVSFWDCGEFISCSYILAVPHPPGAPLFLLIGRLFSLLPFGVEIALKLNWMSAFFNALAIGVIFLILARVINRWFGQIKNLMQAFIVIIGAASGALFAAFGTTYWNNGLETEVYGLAMLISTLCVYFAILWSERHEDPRADRYIILCALLMYLGIGVHLTTLVMLPPLFLFFIIADKSKRFNPVFWLIWFVLFLVATEFNIYIESTISAFIIFALAALLTNNSGGRTVFLTITGVWALIQLFLVFSGTTVPGLIFKDFGLSGKTPNTMGALFQFLIIGGSFVIVATRNYIREWRLGFFTILLCIVAFSLNSYTIIRSRANPYIDENDPETIESFRNYMDRKQYGQESLWSLMFKRKGSFTNQFGTHIRMGFWGFYRDQWTNPDKIPRKFTLNGWIFFIFAYLGVAYAAYKNPRWGALLFFTTLISTIGLLIYLNFSDGSGAIHLEVRNRDYFYTPGYMFMGALIGLGVAALLSFIYRGFKELVAFLKDIGPVMFFLLAFGSLIIMGLVRQDVPYFLGVAVLSFVAGIICTIIRRPEEHLHYDYSSARNAIVVLLGIILVIAPAISPATYWFENNRSRNHIPFDYAFNILDSVDENGIIFTNGDNDTFPLWFLQAVPKIRTDVDIVNLSLLNTNWYIKQIKRAGVPIALSDEQIDVLHAYRDPSTGEIVRVQDLMVEHIIKHSPVKTVIDTLTGEASYYLDPPVFFAVTVAPDNKVGYDPYLEMEGLVYRITTVEGSHKVNREKMRFNLFERYRYSGLNDSTIYKDENSSKLLQNYTTGFITLALEYRKIDDTTGVITTIEKMNGYLPYDWRANAFTAEFYSWAGMWQNVEKFYQIANYNIDKRGEALPDEARLFQMYFEIYYRAKKYEGAEIAIKRGIELFPEDRDLFRAYLGFLYNKRDDETMMKLLEDWTMRYPDDKQFVDFYNQIKQGALDMMRTQPIAEPEKVAKPEIQPTDSNM